MQATPGLRHHLDDVTNVSLTPRSRKDTFLMHCKSANWKLFPCENVFTTLNVLLNIVLEYIKDKNNVYICVPVIKRSHGDKNRTSIAKKDS